MRHKCRWTGKTKFETEKKALRRVMQIRLTSDPAFPRMYAYKCYHCNSYHFSKKSRAHWQKIRQILRRQQQQRIEAFAEVVEARLFITDKEIKGRRYKDEFYSIGDLPCYWARPTIRTWKYYRKTQWKAA